jgi:hypothetical protein
MPYIIYRMYNDGEEEQITRDKHGYNVNLYSMTAVHGQILTKFYK